MYKIPKASFRIMLFAILIFSALSVLVTVLIYEFSPDEAPAVIEVPVVELADVSMYEYRIDSLKTELSDAQRRREQTQKTLNLLKQQLVNNQTQKNEELTSIHSAPDSVSVSNINQWLSSSD